MAQTTKKKTPAKTQTTKKGSASKKQQTIPEKPAKRPIRREVGALVCLLLGLCTLFALFGQKAVVLNWLWSFFGGLVGAGRWLLPFALFGAAVMLFFHRGRPVRLRVTCLMLSVPLLGAVVHLFGDKTAYEFGFSMFGELFKNGAESACGGVIGGLIAWPMRTGLGTALSAVILIALLLGVLAIALNRRIKALVTYLREREKPQYEVKPERERPVREKKPEKRTAPAAIDIPEPGAEPDRETRRERKERLLRERTVASPDEVASKLENDPPAPDYGKLPNEAPAPSDPVAPLNMTPGLVDEPMPDPDPMPETPPMEIEEVNEQFEELPPFSDEEPTDEFDFDEDSGEIAAKPIVSAPVNPKIVDTLGGAKPQSEKAAEKAEAAKVAAEVAAELGRSVTSDQPSYVYPSTTLLNDAPPVAASDATNEMRLNAQRLADTLASFGVDAKINNVTRGPSVTRYELELDRGVKLSKISGLADDIALALGASGVRIAPIPDKISIVGIEVPNKTVATVSLREIIESKEFTNSKSSVSFAVGRDISGAAIVGDIEKLPHMLIAGTTGSGKSVCMNSLIISLLYKSSPEQVRLIMVDPKMIELNVYNGIPHLLIPVVTDPKKAAGALQWAVGEMMNRYSRFRDASVRNISEYNAYVERHEGMKKMPQVVILIDELADLMLVAAKEVEESICRIAQMARAAGMHLVIATQSPRADVITGLMKANIPSRVAFAVASSLESRIIMDTPGAEKLVGRGDMLYLPVGSRKSTRIQGCFVSSAEVERVVEFVKSSGETSYSEEVLSQIERAASAGDTSEGSDHADGADDCDEMLPAAVEVLLETGQASVSMLQRRLKLGYARAARLVDQLERRGIVGPFEGAKPRQLLVTREQWEEMKLQNPEYQ